MLIALLPTDQSDLPCAADFGKEQLEQLQKKKPRLIAGA